MKRTLIPFAGACVILAFAAGAYGFLYRQVATVSAESAALTAQIAAQAEEATRVAAAKRTLVALSEDEASVNQYFVDESDIVSFLALLQKTGKDLGARVEVASVAADDAQEPRIAVALSITGSFDSVLRTLGSIEYGPYDSTLRTLTLENAPDAEGKAAWTATASFLMGARQPKAASGT